MGRTTAKSLLLIKKFADEGAIEGGFRRACERLPSEDRLRINRLRPEDWVDYGFYFRILEAGAAAAGRDPLRFAEEYGIYQAEHDTKLLHRTAMRLGGPGIMIMEADQIWHRYHDTGHLKIYDVLPTSAKARVEELEGGGPLLCAVLQGFITTGLRLTGARDVFVAHSLCRFRGDPGCEYTGNWKK
jgi:hypothetical protein